MTIGTKIIKLEKILDYMLHKQLFKEYQKSLKAKSDSITTYFINANEWKKYKKDRMKEILK